MIGLVKFSSMALKKKRKQKKGLGSAYTLMNIADDDKKKKSDGFIPKLVSGKLAGKPYIQLVHQVKPLFPSEFPFN